MLALREVLDDPLLRDATLLCGSERAAARRVEWFSVIEWPVEDFVQPDDVVMTTALGCDAERFVELVRQVLDARPAALLFALSGESELRGAPAEAVRIASDAGIPLVELPWSVRFAAVARMIADRLGAADGSAAALAPGALDGAYVSALLGDGGQRSVVEVAEARVGAPVVILGAELRVEAAGARARQELGDALSAVQERAASRSTAELLIARRLAADPDTTAEAVDRLGLPAGLLVPAAGVTRAARGYVYAVAGDDALPELQGAARAAAVEQLRAQAVSEAAARAEGELLWAVARGDLRDADEIGRRAARAGHGRTAEYAVAVGLVSAGAAAANDEVTLDAVTLPRLRRGCAHASRTEDGVLVLARADAASRLPALLRDAPGAVWGIADAATAIAGLREAYVRARDAAVAAAVVATPGGVGHEHELGAYLLLARLQRDETARRVADDVLGPLLAYDADTSRDLTRTLDVYLRCHGNTSAAARELHFNRHSLLYRLRKIESLTGRDLDSHDDRFLLTLALRLRRIEQTDRHGPAAQAGRPG